MTHDPAGCRLLRLHVEQLSPSWRRPLGTRPPRRALCPIKCRRAYANHAGPVLGIKRSAISRFAMDFGVTATPISHPARVIRVNIGSRAVTQTRSARNRIRAGWCDESVTAGELL